MHDELVLYFYTYERSVHLQVKWCLNEYVTCHFSQSFLFVCIAEAKKKKKDEFHVSSFKTFQRLHRLSKQISHVHMAIPLCGGMPDNKRTYFSTHSRSV